MEQRQRGILAVSDAVVDHACRRAQAAGLDPVDAFAAMSHATVEIALVLAQAGRANPGTLDLGLLERLYAISDQGWRSVIDGAEQQAAERFPKVDLAALFPGIRPKA